MKKTIISCIPPILVTFAQKAGIIKDSRWDDGISYGRWFICKK